MSLSTIIGGGGLNLNNGLGLSSIQNRELSKIIGTTKLSISDPSLELEDAVERVITGGATGENAIALGDVAYFLKDASLPDAEANRVYLSYASTANAKNAFAGGSSCKAGENSFSYGNYNEALGPGSIAIGGALKSGTLDHSGYSYCAAFNVANNAYGYGSFAANANNNAIGLYTFVGGGNNYITKNYATAFGRWADGEADAYFMVGGGTAAGNKKNIFQVNKDGSIEFCNKRAKFDSTGDLFISRGKGYVTPTKVATEVYVTDTVNYIRDDINYIKGAKLSKYNQAVGYDQAYMVSARGDQNMIGISDTPYINSKNLVRYTNAGTVKTNTPTEDKEAANKKYVDNLISQLNERISALEVK